MKTFFIVLLVLCFYLPIHSRGADPWKEQPILSALRHNVFTAMGEYELWVDDWKKNKRSRTSLDTSINLMAETTFLAIQMALEDHPHPEFLEQCLLFLGTKVPPEFDILWRPRFLEMDYLDKAVSEKVDEKLRAKNLPTLLERALGPKKEPAKTP